LFSSALLLSGCGGGGGGGSSENVASDTPVLVAADYRTTEYNIQYGLGKINADDIYADGYSGSGVVVGVIDTGVDIDHPDLVGNIAGGGYDYVSGDTDASPTGQGSSMSHGTHVAGIIAGMKNDVGMHGVAYSAKILPLRAGNSAGSFASSAIENSIDRAISQNAKVINASFGGSSISTALADKWKLAHTNDIITVHAAGNDGSANPLLGAQLPLHAGYTDLSSTLVAVVAVDSNNTITSYSNRCGDAKNWCMAAPGDSIYSTVAVDDSNYASNYGTMSGTSMADPHVASAAAILRGKWPSKNASEIVTILYDTATDLGDTGVDAIYGRGLLNLDNALFAQGALTISVASGGSHLLGDSTISVASTLGNALNGSFGITIFDRYKRDYAYDMSQLVRHKAHANIENELNFVDNSRSVEIDDLWLKVNQSDQSLKLQAKLKGFDLGFAHNTDFSEVEMEGFSSQYSVSKNAQFASLNSGSSIMIGRPNLSLGLATGYVGVDDRHPAKKLNLSLKTKPTKALSMAVQLGHIQEEETFLANYFSGAYKTGKSNTNTLDFTIKSKLTNDAELILKHAQGVTQVSSLNDSVVSNVSNLKSQQYSATFMNNNNFYKDDVLFATMKKPMHITQGDMTLHMANGLNADDSVSFLDRVVLLSAVDLKTELTVGYSAEYAKDSQITAAYNRINLFNTDLTIDNQFMLKFNQKF